MISSVSIHGFKSFKSLQDFSLRPLNVLIGPNRSGKTNFLDFWDFLSEAGKQQLGRAINKRGGVNSVMSWSGESVLKIELHANIHDASSQPIGFNYVNEITRRNYSYDVALEQLFTSSANSETPSHNSALLNLAHGKGWSYNRLTGKNEEQGEKLQTTELAVAQIRDVAAYPNLDVFRRYLSNLTVHRPFDMRDDAPIRDTQLVGVRDADLPPTRLSRGG